MQVAATYHSRKPMKCDFKRKRTDPSRPVRTHYPPRHPLAPCSWFSQSIECEENLLQNNYFGSCLFDIELFFTVLTKKNNCLRRAVLDSASKVPGYRLGRTLSSHQLRASLSNTTSHTKLLSTKIWLVQVIHVVSVSYTSDFKDSAWK